MSWRVRSEGLLHSNCKEEKEKLLETKARSPCILSASATKLKHTYPNWAFKMVVRYTPHEVSMYNCMPQTVSTEKPVHCTCPDLADLCDITAPKLLNCSGLLWSWNVSFTKSLALFALFGSLSISAPETRTSSAQLSLLPVNIKVSSGGQLNSRVTKNLGQLIRYLHSLHEALGSMLSKL